MIDRVITELLSFYLSVPLLIFWLKRWNSYRSEKTRKRTAAENQDF
jgi:hypothetical protein